MRNVVKGDKNADLLFLYSLLKLVFRKIALSSDGIRLNNGFLYRCVIMGYSNFKLGCSIIYLSVVKRSAVRYHYRKEFYFTKIY